MPSVLYGGDEVSAIVLDIGSHTTRAGYAGEDTPKAVFPTSFSTIPGSPPSHYTGHSLSLYRPHAIHSSPISDGLINNWEAIERTLDYAFKDRLRLQSLEEYPLLVTEPSWNTKENREKMCEIAFEKWDAPAYYGVDKNVMSAFASGKGSALVLDVGAELTSLVPIYDGFVLRKAIQKQPLAGNALSSLILSSLPLQTPPVPSIVPHYLIKSKQPVDPDTPSQAVLREDRGDATESYREAMVGKVLEEFKEGVLEVLPPGVAFDDQYSGAASKGPRNFEFPDGYNSNFGVMRFGVSEALFNPSRFVPASLSSLPLPASPSTIPSHPYSALQPLSKLFQNSLIQIDPDLHATLLSNIVVTGGTSLVQGFTDRLMGELNALGAGGMKVKIHAPQSPAERMYSSWLGGSILASLGTFHQLWIGKDEYQEMGGSSVVHRRAK